MSDLVAGMGWSIYLMLSVVLVLILWIVLMIVRSDKQRRRRAGL